MTMSALILLSIVLRSSLSNTLNAIPIPMMKSSSDQSSKSELREEQTIHIATKDVDYELGAMPEATVAEKHRGTLTDQHDMQVLGRIQELRVGISPVEHGTCLLIRRSAILVSCPSFRSDLP